MKKTKKAISLNEEETHYLKGIVRNQIERLSFYERENKLVKPLKEEFKIINSLNNKLSL